MIKATAQGIEGFGFISKRKEGTAKGTREVRGFVSTSNMDRHGDIIDPLLFDIDTFLKNPQVMVDHGPWITEKGNAISVGRVTNMVAATAVEDGDGGFNIVSLENDEIVDKVPKAEAAIVENGMRGVWGTLNVMEKDVIELIDDGRLNAFSWRGDLVETRFGKHIDLTEVSLVFIPANSKALFMITKSAIRDTLSYVIIKGDGVFADIRKLPDTVAAVIDENVPKYCLYLKREDNRAELMELSLKEDSEADAFSANVYAARADVESVTLLKHTYLMTDHEEPIYEVMNDLSRTEMVRSKWSKEYVNDLPDDAFAYIEPDGKKDEEDKTYPRSLRHFLIKDKTGKYDEAHVRNALVRLPQSEFGDKAKAKVLAAARALGIEVVSKSNDGSTINSEQVINMEGGEEEMAISKEDTANISVAVAAAVRSEFEKVLNEIDTKMAKSETAEVTATEASAEETSTAPVAEETAPVTSEEVVKEAEPATETDIVGAISAAIKAALEGPMGELSKRLETLEVQRPVETQQPNEVADAVTEVKKSRFDLYQAIKDPEEKKKARLIMLSSAMFGEEAAKRSG